MRTLGRVATVVGVWLMCVVAAAIFMARGQAQERDQLVERFQNRTDTGASFVGAYVDDVFAHEERLVPQLTSDAARPDRFERTTALMGFPAAVLLDREGRAVALAPAAPDMVGQDLASRYVHLRTALAGQRAVSDVVPSAVEGRRIVAFAIPLSGPGAYGVFSAGFDLADSPLKAFLERQPVAGTRGYILDGSGTPIVASGGEQTGDERLVAMRRIPGTDWTYVLDAPEEKVLAPVTAGQTREWVLLAVLAAASLAGMLLATFFLLSRDRSRREKAAADHRLRLTVANAPIGMTMIGLDHRFVEPNNRLCSMLGYSADELSEMTFDEVTHPDDIDLDLALLTQLIWGEVDNYEVEKRYLRRDGSPVLGRLSVSIVRDELGEPLHFVSQIVDVTEFRAAQAELEFRAHNDPLTGLANRSLLMDRLDRQLTDGTRVAIGFCDIDHFKQINDEHGHQVGDAVLAEVATRLSTSVRVGDTVARMGGDEFILLLLETTPEDAALVMARAIRSFLDPIEVDGMYLQVGLSAGLAMAGTGATADSLIRQADAALYTAKKRGRGRVAVHEGRPLEIREQVTHGA